MMIGIQKKGLIALTVMSGLMLSNVQIAVAGKVYRLGDTGPGGGIVFYVNPTPVKGGYKYMEVTPQDISDSAVWCDQRNKTIGGSAAWQSQPNGTGSSATDLIAGQCNSSASAIAKAYVSATGKDDWHLPTLGEATQIRTALLSAGKGAPDSNIWTSSEFNNELAWMEDLRTGTQNMDYKYHKWAVRAVRKFK